MANTFLAINDNLDNNYILFNEIEMKIGTNLDIYNYDFIYLENTSDSSYQYSNISIFGKFNKEDEESYKIATFYKKSNMMFGIEDLLNNSVYLNNIKLKLIFTNMIYNSHIMKIYIFIEKQFLLSLYLQPTLPRFLYKIIEDNQHKFQYYITYDKLKKFNLINNNFSLKKQYKRLLYDYQINNIHKMSLCETNILNNNNNVILSKLDSIYNYIYDINEIDTRLIISRYGNIINEDNLDNITFKINGGVLCDNIGLGKTTSMIGLISENININNVTLLICPTRLCKQWIDEILLIYDLKYKLISNITQFKKISSQDYYKYDLIIISYNFIINKNYINYCYDNPNEDKLLHNFNWTRLILDEGHEFINDSNKKSCIDIRIYLYKINTKFKWIISGTPYNNLKDFNRIIQFITTHDITEYNYYFNIKDFKHNCNIFYENCFIKNNKDDLSINIPQPIIDTIFLDMNPLERNIYDSALDDENKQFELCNHIMVSENHLSILGNTPLLLDEIHTKMTEYYTKKINKLTINLDNINNKLNKNNIPIDKIEELNINKTEIIEQLNINKSKFNIFNNIQNKIDETEDCPICLEELTHLTKTMTPCGHIYCVDCINKIKKTNKTIKCAMCRTNFDLSELSIIKNNNNNNNNNKPTMGTKLEFLLNLVKNIIDTTNEKIIIFSQWDNFIKLISKVFTENKINNIFINGSINIVNSKIRKFKLDNTLNVVFISSDKSPSGLNLQEASNIILLDSLNTNKENALSIEEQAIGRAVRIGQTKQVKVKRLIMRNTIEHDRYIRNIS